MKITFINHASVKIETRDLKVLTDPWFRGSAFNDGWNLIYENEDSDQTILDDVNFIWISHEHSDHFQPKFFINNKEFIKQKNIKILFQKTKDDRVKNFLKKIGLEVIELKDKVETKLSNATKCILFKSEFYDSSIFIESNGQSVLNINDCQFNQNDLKKIKNKCGEINILLTQFSYAAWKGGKNNKKWRINASKKKLEELLVQCKFLNPKCLVPFASFVFFSHKENFFMNDSINNIDNVSDFLNSNRINHKILSAKSSLKADDEKFDDQPSKIFWREKYQQIQLKSLNEFTKSYSFNELNQYFKNYKDKIFKKNNKFLMKFVSYLKILKIFQPVIIDIYDINKKIEFNFFNNNLVETSENEVLSTRMHSTSLSFIFNNEFGFDTLSVNALFESDFENFKKLVFNFAIGSYNAAGMFVNFKSIFNLKVILLVFKKLRNLKLYF